ncbi:MAG: hypothetical protein KU29_03145 [Sulfurovum sp. FS06-10]|nr:MAG: hypothetical protein KU29_03145 [Sulfurovum sp. FS06-10]
MRKEWLRKLGVIFIPSLLFVAMRLLWTTYHKKYHFINEPIVGQCMAVTWHAELFIAPQVYRKLRQQQPTSAIISQHFDGDLIAKTLSFLNILPLRGSSKRGAKSVLINAIKAIKEGYSVMITPDGPRGPRYSMSDGAIVLALRSNLPLMVVNYQAVSYWQLKSWDQFVVPKPFTSLDIYHQVLYIEGMEKEEAKKYLQTQMTTYAL